MGQFNTCVLATELSTGVAADGVVLPCASVTAACLAAQGGYVATRTPNRILHVDEGMQVTVVHRFNDDDDDDHARSVRVCVEL